MVLPTTLPTSSPALIPRADVESCILVSARERSCAILLSRMAADSRSVASEQWLLRSELLHPLPQWTSSIGNVSARRDIGQHSQSSASGLFGHPMLVCLWNFVGRARDLCRSTVRASTVTRGTFGFCSAYK